MLSTGGACTPFFTSRYQSRVPSIEIWEGTNRVPISILIWERMLKFLGHVLRAEDTDISKAVTFQYRDGYWLPQSLPGPRARGRPHEEWAHWASRIGDGRRIEAFVSEFAP